jgi:hypothetical protein
MINKATHLTPDLNQVSTADVDVVREKPNQALPQTPAAGPPANTLYPPEGPEPAGTNPAIAQQMAEDAALKGKRAPGVESEQVVWEARYSMKNFIGRLTLATLAGLGWLWLFAWAWTRGFVHGAGGFTIGGLGIAVGIACLLLLYRILQARVGHFYRLTTRRLFVTTGMFRRRRDQMELIGVKDVFERQTLVQRWIGVGTVVVVSPKSELPRFYLTGINDPKRVMDLIWHNARTEREGKTVQVENL